MFCDCSLAKPDFRTKNKSSWTNLNVIDGRLEISVQSSVSSLWSLSVHLDPRLLVGLTTLVAAFLNSSKHSKVAVISKHEQLRVLTVTS